MWNWVNASILNKRLFLSRLYIPQSLSSQSLISMLNHRGYLVAVQDCDLICLYNWLL